MNEIFPEAEYPDDSEADLSPEAIERRILAARGNLNDVDMVAYRRFQDDLAAVFNDSPAAGAGRSLELPEGEGPMPDTDAKKMADSILRNVQEMAAGGSAVETSLVYFDHAVPVHAGAHVIFSHWLKQVTGSHPDVTCRSEAGLQIGSVLIRSQIESYPYAEELIKPELWGKPYATIYHVTNLALLAAATPE